MGYSRCRIPSTVPSLRLRWVTSSAFAPSTPLVSPCGEPVVLRCDKYLSCREIAHWMVTTTVSVGQFDRVAAQREPEQLMAQANAENGDRAVREVPNVVDRIPDGCRVARPVRRKMPFGASSRTRAAGSPPGPRSPAAILHEVAADVALHPVVVGDNVVARIRGSSTYSLAIVAVVARSSPSIDGLAVSAARVSAVGSEPRAMTPRIAPRERI